LNAGILSGSCCSLLRHLLQRVSLQLHTALKTLLLWVTALQEGFITF